MTYLLWGYMLLFALAFVGLFWVEVWFTAPDERDPLVENVLDLVLAVLLFAGMVFYATEPELPLLRDTWKVVSVVLAIYAVTSNWMGRRQVLKAPDEPPTRRHVAIADFMTLLLMIPSLVLGFLYAFGG